MRLLGQSFVVLNSEKIARALLDQRSALYSDRPVIKAHSMYVMSLLFPCKCLAHWVMTRFGMDFSTVMLPYNDEWRLHRKLFQHALRAECETRNRKVYLKRARILLVNLLDAPAEFELHIKRFNPHLLLFLVLITMFQLCGLERHGSCIRIRNGT